MGKVLKPLAIVGAIGLAFLPGAQGVLAGVLSGVGIGGGVTAFGYAAAGAIASVVGTIGATFALGTAAKALGLGPKQPRISPATASLPPMLRERLERPTIDGMVPGSFRRMVRRQGMMPIRPWWHYQRWQVNESTGDCLVPHCRAGSSYTLTDRAAEIRPDDLVSLHVKRRHGGNRLCKRFVTADDTHFEFETTNPTVETFRIRRDHVASLYRVRAHLRDKNDWQRRVREIEADPRTHNERLGIVLYSARLLG
jgi:hypothetical protein